MKHTKRAKRQTETPSTPSTPRRQKGFKAAVGSRRGPVFLTDCACAAVVGGAQPRPRKPAASNPSAGCDVAGDSRSRFHRSCDCNGTGNENGKPAECGERSEPHRREPHADRAASKHTPCRDRCGAPSTCRILRSRIRNPDPRQRRAGFNPPPERRCKPRPTRDCLCADALAALANPNPESPIPNPRSHRSSRVKITPSSSRTGKLAVGS
jgi:hypothetical protein